MNTPTDQLITLSNGRRGLRSGLQVQTLEPSSNIAPSQGGSESPAASENQTPGAVLDFIASDETLDRCDEVIAATGWRLEAYRRNPVFQNAHQYGDVIFTIGKALITEVRLFGGQPSLFQRVQFAVEANPMARIAYALYKGKFLNAVSVGFIPLRWEDGERGAKERGASERGGLPRRRYLEQELLEVSAVGIPANPNALQLGLKAGAIQKSDLQDLLELLRSGSQPSTPTLHDSSPSLPATLHDSITPLSTFRSNPAVHDTHARASGVGGNEAQLLQLARDVLQVLRNT